MHISVALGVIAATAVLTGALVVGDSMRESLREMALRHLGRIDDALVSDHFFREELAKSNSAAPLIVLSGGLDQADTDPPLRANQVQIIGCDERFWALGKVAVEHAPGRQEVILTAPVAEQLAVKAGDTVLVRLPRPGMIPSESALGRKRDTVRSVRMKVVQIISADGLGGFTLQPSQREPRNAFVDLGELQYDLEQPGKANAMVKAGSESPAEFRPQLEDFGLRVVKSKQGYIDISSESLLLSKPLEAALTKKLLESGAKQVQPALVYLANTIACGKKEVPYSTIAALDIGKATDEPLGPFLDQSGKTVGQLADNQIAINDWTAQRLQAHLGDTIRVAYFEPVTFTGVAHEVSKEFKLAAILPLQGAAADPQLTPTVKGLSDKRSISDWDPPFPFDNSRVHKDDEQYWKDHRATPKAFVSLATGQRLWGSRFGQTTSLRVDPGKLSLADIKHISLDPNPLGFAFQSVRQQILSASSGTTPFDVLFLSFSMFVIAAALILVALLFRLGVERAPQMGILLAVGFEPGQVSRLLVMEGIVIAIIGSVLGTAAGVGYAALMLLGLRTWWLAAIVTPFLRLHASPQSLGVGLVSGSLMAWLAIWFSVRRMSRLAPRRLLAGDTTVPKITSPRKQSPFFDAAMLLAAVLPAIALYFYPLSEDVQVGAFFGAGSWALAALVWLVYRRLKHGATGQAIAPGPGNLLRLALRNSARNPGRSSLSIALVSSAAFLIVAVSVFNIQPEGAILSDRGGSGGFKLICQSDQPIYFDLGTPQGRSQLELSAADEALLSQATIFAFRVKAGDDASCLNLYAPRQPRILGVTTTFIDHAGTRFIDAAGGKPDVFRVLEPQVVSSAHPVILDRATADYSLHRSLGETFKTVDSRGAELNLEVAALLDNSIFQGDMLISEEALLHYDPMVTGYRYFLVDCPPQAVPAVRQTLERTLEDYGFVAQPAAERLAQLLSIQNTYISTFQSLGGLGLLLGTFGLAVVELRNLLERRGELALLRAIGFRNGQLLAMVVFENIFLLLCGLAIGLVAAAIAVWPQMHHHAGSIPWATLAAILASVAVVGTLASFLAAFALARMPLLASLREER